MTQRELGREIGLTMQTISLLETSKTTPSAQTAVRAAQFFGQSLDYMVLGRGKRRSF